MRTSIKKSFKVMLIFRGINSVKQTRPVFEDLLWNVHTKLDGLLLPAGDLVEDVLPGGGSAVAADVVSFGEGLTILLRHLPELAFTRNE